MCEGLLKGAVMSQFGTTQANRDIWGADGDAERLQTRIRDLLLVIALDSLCLAEIVPATTSEPSEFSLLRSRDKIMAIHLFLLGESEDLAANTVEDESEAFPVWPMPVLCLAWSIVLNSLSPEMLPLSPGYSGPIHQEFAIRALRLSSGLFPWLEQLLAGPLFEPGKDELVGDTPDEAATSHRVVIKGIRPLEVTINADGH